MSCRRGWEWGLAMNEHKAILGNQGVVNPIVMMAAPLTNVLNVNCALEAGGLYGISSVELS